METNNEINPICVIQYFRTCLMEIRNCPQILSSGLNRSIGRPGLSGGLPPVKKTTAENSNLENSQANPTKTLTSP